MLMQAKTEVMRCAVDDVEKLEKLLRLFFGDAPTAKLPAAWSVHSGDAFFPSHLAGDFGDCARERRTHSFAR